MCSDPFPSQQAPHSQNSQVRGVSTTHWHGAEGHQGTSAQEAESSITRETPHFLSFWAPNAGGRDHTVSVLDLHQLEKDVSTERMADRPPPQAPDPAWTLAAWM